MVEETRNKTAQNLQWALEGQDKRSATRSIVNGWNKSPAPSAGAILKRGKAVIGYCEAGDGEEIV